MQDTSTKRFLTLTELAERWGYKVAVMHNASSRGTLPIPVRRLMPNGDPRFSLDDVERHERDSVERHEQDSAEPTRRDRAGT